MQQLLLAQKKTVVPLTQNITDSSEEFDDEVADESSGNEDPDHGVPDAEPQWVDPAPIAQEKKRKSQRKRIVDRLNTEIQTIEF